MLTPEDIQKITEAQIEAQKDLFYTKSEMDEKFSSLQTSMDSIIKDKATRDTEAATTTYKIEKIETWIDQAAPKLDIKFEH